MAEAGFPNGLEVELSTQQARAEPAMAFDGGDDGLTGLRPPGALAAPTAYYFFALACVLPSVYALRRLVRSPFGLTLRALRNNPLRVQYSGVDVRRHQLITFVVAGAFAGLAGALLVGSSVACSLALAWEHAAPALHGDDILRRATAQMSGDPEVRTQAHRKS